MITVQGAAGFIRIALSDWVERVYAKQDMFLDGTDEKAEFGTIRDWVGDFSAFLQDEADKVEEDGNGDS